MTDNIEHIILEQLRAIRTSLARHDEQFDTLIMRMGSMESQMAGLHGDIAGVRTDIAGIQVRMDRFDNRLSRIERRLELRDETA